MNGKLALETTKKLLLNNVLLLLAYLVCQTVSNFAANEYITLPIYVESALQLIALVLYALCIASIVISLYKTIVVDLFSGKSYKYYSLPCKKSEIIFSKAVPAIIIESLIVALLFNDDLQQLLVLSFNTEDYTGDYRREMLNEWTFQFLRNFAAIFLFAAAIGFLILLALVVSRSFDPSKTVRNFVLAIIIEGLANTALFTVIMNIESELDVKCRSAVRAIPELAAKEVFSPKEIYPSIGLLAYWYEIISVIVLVILLLEIVCPIIVTKRLANKRFNVI